MAKLKEMRIAKGMTQKQVADVVGVSESAYQKWEAGKNRIPSDFLGKVCKTLNMSPYDLIGMDEADDPMLEIPIKTYAVRCLGWGKDGWPLMEEKEMPPMPREEANGKGYCSVGLLLTKSEAFACLSHMQLEPGLSLEDAFVKYVQPQIWAKTKAGQAQAQTA